VDEQEIFPRAKTLAGFAISDVTHVLLASHRPRMNSFCYRGKIREIITRIITRQLTLMNLLVMVLNRPVISTRDSESPSPSTTKFSGTLPFFLFIFYYDSGVLLVCNVATLTSTVIITIDFSANFTKFNNQAIADTNALDQ
jgi:hypothetical protein